MGITKPHDIYDREAVAYAGVEARADFIVKTYIHLIAAIGLFAILCAVWYHTPATRMLAVKLLSYGSFAWLAFLGGFMIVSLIAHKMAEAEVSVGAQYFGLALYVTAESFLFLPLLVIAGAVFPGSIEKGASIAAVIFAGLTAFVFVTRKNFSFLRGVLCVGALAALGAIVAGAIFQFELGIVFTAIMLALAAGFILYDTSNILYVYPPGRHVAASLALFSSVALLLWYAIRLAMYLQSSDD